MHNSYRLACRCQHIGEGISGEEVAAEALLGEGDIFGLGDIKHEVACDFRVVERVPNNAMAHRVGACRDG